MSRFGSYAFHQKCSDRVVLFTSEARFTPGNKANVQLKSSIPIGAKLEISPKGFTLGIKAEIEKIFSICPKLLINAEH
jgi:hypothetical protein